MPDVNVAYSQNGSLSAKAFVDNVADKIKSGVGSLSEAAQGAAGTASAKIKSFFKPTDVQGNPRAGAGTSPQKAMENNQRPLGPLEYPAQMKYYTLFSFKEYQRGVALSKPADKTTAHIILPIPSNLTETFGVDYDTPALGPIVGAVASSVLAGQRQAQDYSGPPVDGKQVATGAAAVVGAGALGAIKATSERAAGVAEIAAGVAPNPHMAVAFRNIGLREHSFSYRLAPNSAAELAKVKEIIRQLKIRMLPNVTEGADSLFTYPDICDISFATGTMESFKIKRCVLKSLSVNYAPNGPAFFKTGDPVIVEISMTFMESTVFTRRDLGEKAASIIPSPTTPPSSAPKP
jgi:hypothetical protein